LDNLLANAFQYGCAGTDRRVAVHCTVEDSAVAIAVQDHGPGFVSRFHERVFEIFRRLDPAGPVPGTGVGLAAVHRLIKRIGGTVTLDSAAGRGATFTIRFPVQVLTFGGSGG
jgi:signal transduction histidine kinase